MARLFSYGTACVAAACCCSSLGPLSGTSEQGNAKVVASVYTSQGDPAAGVSVMLRRTDYLSDTGTQSAANTRSRRNTVVGSNGSFTIDSLDTGAYTVEVNDNTTEAVLFRFAIIRPGQILQLGADTLQPYAAIRGTVDIGTAAARRYVQVFGLERIVMLDSIGGYALSNLPAGTFRLRFFTVDIGTSPLIFDSLTVASGQTLQVSYTGWKYSKLLYLNTTASGANISDTVYRFPVLVRLTDSNFTFSQARSDGGDLRFTKADDKPLYFDITRWDSAACRAEIWVSVDTVYGKDSTHYFKMSWGNAAAVNGSNSAAVFDAANGFIAVWHLDTNCSDATGSGNNGTNYGATDVAGTIGSAKEFDGRDSIKVAGLLGAPSNVTLSAWVSTDTAVPYGQEIVSIGNCVLIRAEEVDTAGAGAYYLGSNDVFVPITSGRFSAGTGWHYVAFTFSNSSLVGSLYIDGALSRSFAGTSAIKYSGQSSNTYIGAHGNGQIAFNSRGEIDEVRVCSSVRSADWIKLCYMNQRSDDRLVVVK
jgi:hypothetical protein